MALIGSKGWDPIAESMWGITAKLSKHNFLDWVESRWLYGGKREKSFRTPADQDPNKQRNFNLSRLLCLTGWDPDVLCGSFPFQYFPFWIDSEEEAWACGNLRVCFQCLKHGTHLVVHQLSSWHRCPLHLGPLESVCPHCGKGLGPYAIVGPKVGDSDVHDAANCASCDHLLLESAADSDATRRRQFFGAYTEWLRRIEELLNPDRGHLQCISGLDGMWSLAHIAHVVPGPKWTKECLVNGREVRKSKVVWTGTVVAGAGMRTYSFPGDPRFFRRVNEYQPLPTAVLDYSRLIGDHVRQTGLRIKQDFSWGFDGIVELNSRECIPRYGELITAWDAGRWLWNRCFDEAFAPGVRMARARFHRELYESWLWQVWVEGVGRFLLFRARSFRYPANVEFVRWLTAHWLPRYCEERYFQFVGLALRNIGRDRPMESFYLDRERGVGDASLWLLKQTAKKGTGRTEAIRLATISPYGEFLALRRSGFRGSDLGFSMSFERQLPLLALLKPRPDDAAMWHLQWKELKRALERRAFVLQCNDHG